MKTKLLLICAVFLIVLLSGCPELESAFRTDGTPYSGTGPFDDPNTNYYDTGDPNSTRNDLDSGSENCGYFEGPCCEWFGTDEFGMLTGRYYCDEGYECRAEICVEGPNYQAYDRTTGGYGYE